MEKEDPDSDENYRASSGTAGLDRIAGGQAAGQTVEGGALSELGPSVLSRVTKRFFLGRKLKPGAHHQNKPGATLHHILHTQVHHSRLIE